MSLARGSLVLVDLEPTLGHEQRGSRPCLVVSDPAVNASQRFPLLAVVPITGTPAPGALYPPLAPGANGLTKPSCALVESNFPWRGIGCWPRCIGHWRASVPGPWCCCCMAWGAPVIGGGCGA